MIHVLIVDDERVIGQCLQRQVDWEKLGCDIPEVCYNAQQALQNIEKAVPDIVITDIRMPSMDGIDLCRLLHEHYPAITTFIISAYEDFEVAQTALQYNVKGYVLKPFDRAGLQNIEDMMSRALAKQQRQKLRTALLSNTIQAQLEEIINKKDEVALDKMLDMVSIFREDPMSRNITMWLNLVMPAVRSQCVGQETRQYLEGKKACEQIRELSFQDRITFVREKYRNSMQDVLSSHSSNVVYYVQKVVDKEFTVKELNVATLAERFRISPAYLGSLFAQVTGVGLAEYIRGKRLDYACEQLCTGNKSISDIALGAGFSNVNYFTKVFRKNLGIPPAEYRKKFRKKA